MGVVNDPVKVRLELESFPENVALVRSAVAGIAEAVALSDELNADLKTAVSEACNNVALHAYDDEAGPMLVELDASGGGIHVSVVDHGHGINRIAAGDDHMGLGLAVISALSDRSEFRHPPGGGTEVQMWFRLRIRNGVPDQTAEGWDAAEAPRSRHSSERQLPPAAGDARPRGEIRLTFAPAGVARHLLGRIVQSLAASSHFSVAKISDLRPVNAAIARYIAESAEESVSIAISTAARRLSIMTGPLPAHDPDSAQEALGAIVDRLSSTDDTIRIELLDRARDPA